MADYVLSEKSVAKLRGLLRLKPGTSIVPGAQAGAISIDDFPPPFTVRWNAKEANGSGAWCIWLPDRAKLVMRGVDFIPSIGGVSAAQNLPGGWYTIDDAQATSTTAYLVVTVVAATGVVSATISAAPGQAVTGSAVYNVTVATMTSDAQTGAKRVKQFVDSVVEIADADQYGNPVTPDDISTEFIPDPPSGTQPDGDEGKLQIYGFKAGQPADQNTLPDYLQGVAQIPSTGIMLVCRAVGSLGREILYIPLAALDVTQYLPDVGSYTFVTDIQYDIETKQLQKKTQTVTVTAQGVAIGQESPWTMITGGQATPHSAE